MGAIYSLRLSYFWAMTGESARLGERNSQILSAFELYLYPTCADSWCFEESSQFSFWCISLLYFVYMLDLLKNNIGILSANKCLTHWTASVCGTTFQYLVEQINPVLSRKA